MILADGNLLIAFKWIEHVHHGLAKRFFAENPKVATCPITELNLVRVLMSQDVPRADDFLADFILHHRSRLIPCDISATEIAGLARGHKQTTDVYLAKLAKKHKLKVATLDEQFAKKFPDLVELVQ